MNVDVLTTPDHYASFFRVFARLVQCIFVGASLVPVGASGAELRQGENYVMSLADVDQRQHSISDGHVTVITVVTRKDESKAELVGDRYPRECMGNSKFRLITVINFQQKVLRPLRGVALAFIRHRLNAEAKELQKVYASKQLERDARADIFVTADFDGKIVSQLGIAPTSDEFRVLVFAGQGRLVKIWDDVPSAEALFAAMRDAQR
jgi:hypothetical protein